MAKAVEAEVIRFIERYRDVRIDGKQAVVRNGYLQERTVQAGIGDVSVKVPKVRDHSEHGIKFNSALLPPYLKRTKALAEVIPWLYLKGVSTGDMQPALESLLGEQAKGLSANTVSRLKLQGKQEYDQWCQRDLSRRRHVYLWADGIYSKVRMHDKLFVLAVKHGLRKKPNELA